MYTPDRRTRRVMPVTPSGVRRRFRRLAVWGLLLVLRMSYILGISAFYHDSAACLLRDGAIVAAAQEERFTRKKGDAGFPRHAAQYCLETAGIGASDLAYVGFYDKPLLKFERILETYLGVAPRGFTQFRLAGPAWMKEKLFQDRDIRDSLGMLYSAFTYFTGFKVNSGEYKVMGLAPYGEPKYVDAIYRELIDLREDGSFTLNQT